MEMNRSWVGYYLYFLNVCNQKEEAEMKWAKLRASRQLYKI